MTVCKCDLISLGPYADPCNIHLRAVNWKEGSVYPSPPASPRTRAIYQGVLTLLHFQVVHTWVLGIYKCSANLGARKVFLGIQSCRVWEGLGQRVRDKSSWGELLSGVYLHKAGYESVAGVKGQPKRYEADHLWLTTKALNQEGD